MKQLAFERTRRDAWQRFSEMLETLEAQAGKPSAGSGDPAFIEAYRETCRDLAIARTRGYAAAVCDELNDLVRRGHNLLYARRTGTLSRAIDFIAAEFPRQVRRDAPFVWAATGAFLLPLILIIIAVATEPDVLYSIMEEGQVRQMEAMYRPDAERLGRARASDSDFAMFGFYIWNNVSIGFQVFATGLALGLGTLFYLAYNGIFIGAVSGHLVGIGYGSTFLPFVAGHGAFELTAIVLSGAAGLKLGYALLAPGPLSRGASLRQAAAEAVTLVIGTTAMLFVAAFIEAYWSSTTWPPAVVKYLVGALLWALVIGYLTLAGRRHAA